MHVHCESKKNAIWHAWQTLVDLIQKLTTWTQQKIGGKTIIIHISHMYLKCVATQLRTTHRRVDVKRPKNNNKRK